MRIQQNRNNSAYRIVALIITLGVYFSLLIGCSGGDSGGGGGSNNQFDTYSEFDITVSGASIQYFTDSDLGPAGEGVDYIMKSNYSDESWPDNRLRAYVRVDLFDLDSLVDNAMFDFSQNASDVIYATSVVYTSRETPMEDEASVGYGSGDHPSLAIEASGTITINKFILPEAGDPFSEAYKNAVEFDIEIHDAVMPLSGGSSSIFPNTITVNYARFCRLSSGCENKQTHPNLAGEYNGGPVTVISSNCLDVADDGPYTFDSSSLVITEDKWGQFNATVQLDGVEEGFSVVSTEEITATLTGTEIVGTVSDTMTIDGFTVSSGSGSVDGVIDANEIILDFTGQDTSGDTCSWTAQASFNI